jgi:hypothetical protein
MKEFTPSPHFVHNTMASIRQIEKSKRMHKGFAAVSATMRYAGMVGALLVGIINLLRLLAAVYAPIVCH